MTTTKNAFPQLSKLRIGSIAAPRTTAPVGTRRTWVIAARWRSTHARDGDSTKRQSSERTPRQNEMMGICYVPSPETTNPSTVLEKLLKWRQEDFRGVGLRRALFLVTPGIAKWFGPDSDFHRDLMHHVVCLDRPIKYGCRSAVAVVDALPPPDYFQDRQSDRARPCFPMEGVAIHLRTDRDFHGRRTQGSTQIGVLRVISSPLSGEFIQKVMPVIDHPEANNVIRISATIPLANTLFVNGMRNTAFEQKWKPSKDGSSLHPQGDSVALEVVGVPTEHADEQGFDHNVPLHTLTVGREVLSSMGNVVREVRGDDGKPLKASAELEAIVPKMLAKQRELDEEAQIQIFAKVMPPRFDNDARSDDALPKSSASKIGDDLETALYTETSTALYQQGRIHRVTSGGGGWGKKAGLLSLDPATNFEPPEDSETSMFPDPDAIENKLDTASGIKALVPAGHSIQFFAAQVQRPHPHGRADKGERGGAAPRQIVMGAVPSRDTIQSSEAQKDAKDALPFMLPNCFGALSEGGSSICSSNVARTWSTGGSSRKTVNEFRVDVPYATFKLLLDTTPRWRLKKVFVEEQKPTVSVASRAPQIRRVWTVTGKR